MKTVEYSGPPLPLGRFGTIEDGAIIPVSEAEFAGIRDDERFKLLSRRKPPRDIAPEGTPFFDLRNIQWSHPKLMRNLASKGKSTLLNIVHAMNSLGCELVVTVHDNSPLIADAIYTEAVALGWTKLTKEDLRALGQSEVTSQEDDKDDDDQGEGNGEGGGDAGIIDLNELSAKDLRELCVERGLPKTGSKTDLIERLEAHAAESKSEEDGEEGNEGGEVEGDTQPTE